MIRTIFVLCMVVMVAACKDKEKVSMTGDDEVEAADFVEFFPPSELPFTIADTTLAAKTPDTAVIAWSVFTNFVPDSVVTKDFGKATPKIYALGRAREKNKEIYLFVKAVHGKKSVAYLITFNKKNEFLKALPLVRKGFTSYAFAYGSLDKKFQITTYREQATKTGENNFKRNVYIYNSSANDFLLILTEPNVEFEQEVINPIDTLPQKNKYTGDYVYNKKNYISFRDGRTTSEIQFFVHFEKSKGECVGELKGTARFVSAKKAVYNQSGNPCTLEFTFTTTSVIMKEIEGCGTYRDIKCFFEGTYPKKKRKTTKNDK